ncbi:unnamed protein product [Orchesella dallaii]|uniref:Uncharacterized protein n=1 Tax=Orchesella dallaii TaxID=48710 RepID=A0ABP1PQX1_9HEXA
MAKYMSHRERKRDKMEDRIVNTLSVFVFVLSITCGLLICSHYFMFPKSAPYITYLIPDMYFFTWIYVLTGLGFLVPCIGYTTVLSAAIIIAISFFAYMRPIYATELKLGLHHSKYKASNKLREPSHLIRNWKAIELLLEAGNKSMGFGLVPLQTIFTKLALFCNVTFVLFGNELQLTSKIAMPVIAIFAIFGWSIFLSIAGNLFLTSKATLNSWKISYWTDKKSRLLMKKYKRSLKPLTIHGGSYFVIRPKSVLNFLRGTSRGTFRALVAVRKTLSR